MLYLRVTQRHRAPGASSSSNYPNHPDDQRRDPAEQVEHASLIAVLAPPDVQVG